MILENVSRLTENIEIEDIALESFQFFQYTGWVRLFFITFLLSVFITECIAKLVIFSHLASVKISNRPINMIFIADQVFRFLIMNEIFIRNISILSSKVIYANYR